MFKLIQGFGYNARGLRYFFRHKSLWKFAFIPLLLNLLSLIFFISLYTHFYDDVFRFLLTPFGQLDVVNPQNFWQHALDVAYWVLRAFLQVLIFVISFLLIVICVYLLSLIVNGPFYEILSERVLMLEGARQEKTFAFKVFFQEILHALKVEVFKVSFFIVITVCLFALSWIPIAGFLFTILQFFFTAWFFAFGVCIYPLVLERVPVKGIFSWGRHHKLHLIGFGLPALVPFLGLLLMNFQVIGGTLLYLEKKNA
jgi:CysZ protein